MHAALSLFSPLLIPSHPFSSYTSIRVNALNMSPACVTVFSQQKVACIAKGRQKKKDSRDWGMPFSILFSEMSKTNRNICAISLILPRMIFLS